VCCPGKSRVREKTHFLSLATSGSRRLGPPI